MKLSIQSFCLLIVIIIIFPLLRLHKYVKAIGYEECTRPFQCGNVNISYPFYDQHNGRPAYCGFPGFEINCTNNSAEISVTTTSEKYYILQMDPNSTNISVTRKHAWTTYCPETMSNTTLNWTLFNYQPSVENVTLYYNCSDPNTQSQDQNQISQNPIQSPKQGINQNQISNQISCRNSDSFDYFMVLNMGSDPNYLNTAPDICKSNVFIPLYQNIAASVTSSNTLQSAFSNGTFGLEWIAEKESCNGCRSSGGVCGHDINTQKFTCHCPGNQLNEYSCHGGPRHSVSKSMVVILAIISGIGVGICVLVVLILSSKKRRLSSKRRQDVEVLLRKHGSPGPKRYTYSDLKRITNSFKDKLGEGGYGVVYRGKLQDGHQVAVKILKNSSNEDMEEFINEVASIGNTNHVNIVKLLGFCYEGGKKRALVYDYMPNGSLEKFTYRGNENHPLLSWEKLFDIVVGIARGLEYLHRGCDTRILHFDIKPQNILLDEDFCPKISDFGLAKSCPQKDSIIPMSEARGTIGYIAPEVFFKQMGGVSYKSDVYSYGMLVLEIVGCRNNTDARVESRSEQYFPEWIYRQLEQVKQIDDQQEGISNADEESLRRKMILVSLWCIQTHPRIRPNMSQVVEMLGGPLESLHVPPRDGNSVRI